VLLDEGVGLGRAEPEGEAEAQRIAAVCPLPCGGAYPAQGLGTYAWHAEELLLPLLAQQHAEGVLAKLLLRGRVRVDVGEGRSVRGAAVV
tara:strand:+ start:398 stop:667 length:270 start_codon:yes stop_codon:yes gene_type:complete